MNCDFELVGDVFRCHRCGQAIPRRGAADRAFAECGVHPAPWRDPPPVRNSPCAYLGPELRRERCQTCRGHVQKKIFACALHGETDHDRCQACPDFFNRAASVSERSEEPGANATGAVLIRFSDGLGDHVQFQVVLKHLREHRPDLAVDVACPPSCMGMLYPLCRRIFPWPGPPGGRYEYEFSGIFREPTESFASHPSGKAEHCLRKLFGILPRPELCGYEFEPSAAAKAHVDRCLHSLLATRYSLFHYRGRARRSEKTLDEQAVVAAARLLARRGITPVVLDWDNHSGFCRGRLRGKPFPHIVLSAGHPLWGGRQYADAEILCALAQRSILCIGVDSGPGHLFQASGSPTIIIWPQPGFLHPLHHSGNGPNTLHLLHRGHEVGIRAPKNIGLDYFHSRYRHRVMRGNLRSELPALVEEMLAKNG